MGFSSIPLPKVLYDVGPGGRLITSGQGVNAFNKERLENKFAPLETAIKAQNALSYNSRTGNVGMFLRGIAQMPAAERQAYLADPDNRSNYMKMLEEFRTGAGSSGNGGSGNILSPEYVSSFGIGAGGNAGNNGNPMNPLNMLKGLVGGNPLSSKEGPSQSPQNNSAVPTNEEQNSDKPFGAYVPPPGAPAQPKNVDDEFASQPVSAQPSSSDEQASATLSPTERAALSSQQQSNNMTAGKVQSARAEGAATMDKYLMDNRPMFAKAIDDATKYQGIYGRGKNWLEKFQKNQPEEYANYQFVKQSLLGNLGNQIRFMEHMGATDTQSAHANAMVAALDQLDQSPDTSRKIINKNISSLMKLSNSIYQVAEPRFPGTHKKLFGIPELKGDYIPESKSSGNKQNGEVEKVFDLSQFSSPAELNLFYKNQNKASQMQIRKQLEAGVL